MRNIKIKSIIMVLFSVILLTANMACTKDPGFDGKSNIVGTVTYKSATESGVAAAAVVNIKFNSTVATDSYDYSTITDANGKYSINQLAKGDYFVDAVYIDANGFEFNTPGFHVNIGGNNEEVTVDMEVQ